MSYCSALLKLISSGRSVSLIRPQFLAVEKSLKLPHRTAVKLRRINGLPPIDDYADFNRPNAMEHEYNMFEVVEDDETIERPPIKVILTEFVEDLGKPGQIVEVDSIDGYMQYILPRRALYATPQNIKKVKLLADSEIDKHSTISAYKTMKMLRSKTLSIFMNMNQPWTIEPWHIRATLRQNGVHVMDDKLIELPSKPISGPDMALEGKDFAITITINNCEKPVIRCRLRHWTNIFSDKIILPPDHECVPAEAIFPEQEEILKQIPLPKYVEEVKYS